VQAEPTGRGIELRTPAERILTRTVVNAAGLYADDVSTDARRRRLHDLSLSRRVRGAGSVETRARQRLVYPLPHTHGLGVHLTKTVHGNVSLGPTACFQDRKDDYEGHRIPIEAFLEPAQRLLPDSRSTI
jgi:glycerol-3-phosphate dehydrogenase